MKIDFNNNYEHFLEESIIYQYFLLTLKKEKFFKKSSSDVQQLYLLSARLTFEFYVLLHDKSYQENDFSRLSLLSQEIINNFKKDLLFNAHFNYSKKYLSYFFLKEPKKHGVLVYELNQFLKNKPMINNNS